MIIGKKSIALTLSALFITMQMLPLKAIATEITGVTGNNGVYNINPTDWITGTDIGYRKYTNFDLSQGDVANLIFQYGPHDIETFINMVDNKININGIVNSMRDGSFYNGKAIFVSPNGMIIGASGVLNVGSLGVYTPTTSVYNNYKNNPNGDFSTLTSSNNNGYVTVNGKVIATNDIDIYSGNINVNSNAGMLAGTGNNQIIVSNVKAEDMFNNLVNTRNINKADSIINSNGNIRLSSTVGTAIDGIVNNYGRGNTTIINSGSKGIKITGRTENHNGDYNILNKNGDIQISGTVANRRGTMDITNNGNSINLTSKGKIDNSNTLKITNNGKGGMHLNGTVTNSGNSNILNTAGSLNIGGSFNNTNNTVITNNGSGNLTITGKIDNGKDLNITNNGKELLLAKGATIKNGNDIKITNSGIGGMQLSGSVNNGRNATVINKAGGLNIGGSFANNNGDSTFENTGNEAFNVTGTVTNKGGTLNMYNKNDSLNIAKGATVSNTNYTHIKNDGYNGLNIGGTIINGGNILVENTGTKGLNITGKINADGSIMTSNIGQNGTYLASEGRLTSKQNIAINDDSKGGIRVQGLVNAKRNVDITQNGGGNVVIGDKTNNDYYVRAGKDINIKVNDGSLLNYGVEKVLLAADGDLTMKVTNGTIGLPSQQKVCEGFGCTGVGPKSEGSRDFTKSINANIGGKVNATTVAANLASQKQDLVINYAAIDSDMNIDTIKADGRVILTADDSGHAFNGKANGKRYDIINARPNNNSDTNIEGRGLSIIANGSIGSKDNKVTFIQNGAKQGYSMDALANENIYLKENSYNDSDYGADKEITQNEVCTMIAREGDLDVEFAGNTFIQNITAEGDMNIVTRGKSSEIKNLGHISDDSVTPKDYFGPRNQGQKDGGYMKPDYRDEALPNHVKVAALDINKNIRRDGEMVDGEYWGYADSIVRIKNAVLDNGTLDITADNIHANGIEAHFNKDGFSKTENKTTNPVIGASEIPTGRAVRPADVSGIGRSIYERNYYYPEGDGDGIFDGKKSNVDPDDKKVDATPLAIPDEKKPGDNPDPGPGPGPDPDPDPDPDPTPTVPDGQSGDITYIQRKIVDNAVEAIDKRQYMRFRVSDNSNPVLLEKQDNGVSGLLDISRGGIAVKHNNTLKAGDVVPVHLAYGDLDINADVKIVSATSSRAGAEFVNIDKALANQLLYLSILLESQNNMLA
ncbi:leukotoxin LktA family filamentous adhesin, partial [bacterium]|nr:leukotoxin LktA family filamentous adhesin [bacterium]